MQELTAIVPFWNGHETIERLLRSLPVDLPVIIVDDHSDKALDLDVEIIRPLEKGYFSGAVNAGMRACDTDVLILNQDVWLEDGWLDHLNGLREKHQIVGDGVMSHPVWPQGYVQGTFMYVARAVIERVGFLNERDYPLWGSTCEYQLRACRKGFSAYPTEEFNQWMKHEPRPEGSPFGPAITEAIKREPNKKNLFIRTPPAISVVVPCYNYGRYLTDCINSLIGGDTCLGLMDGQTFQSFEVIIVDDASTDETAEIGRAFADPWKGIRYIRHKRNLGTPFALNTGVKAARGQYITILSADDMLEPWHLDSLYRECEANPQRVTYGDLRQLKSGQRDKALKLPQYNFEQVLKKNPMSAGIMYPKKAWREAGGYSEIMVEGREDWAFNIALGIQGWCGLHVGGPPGYLIRREKQNRSLTTATADYYRFFRRQLTALFPAVYAGDRPMGCCGPRKAAVVAKNPTARVQREVYDVGVKGMALVVFELDIGAPKTIYGPVTGIAYQFGGRRKIGRVDKRDLRTGTARNPGFLEMYQGKKRIFRETKDPGKAPPRKKVEPPVEEFPLLSTAEIPDPSSMKVKEIKEFSGSLDDWKALREAEENGKNRGTAIKFIDAAIADAEGQPDLE